MHLQARNLFTFLVASHQLSSYRRAIPANFTSSLRGSELHNPSRLNKNKGSKNSGFMIPFFGHTHHIPSSSRLSSTNGPPNASAPASRSNSRTRTAMNSRRNSPGPGQGPPNGLQGPPGQHTPGGQHPPQQTQSLNGTPMQQHPMQPQQMMGQRPDERSYAQALKCLDSLPSNASVVASLSTHSSTGGDPNLKALPEMIDFFARASYSPADLARLSCIHVAGTKGKGSVCAMIQSILEAYREDYRIRRSEERRVGKECPV